MNGEPALVGAVHGPRIVHDSFSHYPQSQEAHGDLFLHEEIFIEHQQYVHEPPFLGKELKGGVGKKLW